MSNSLLMYRSGFIEKFSEFSESCLHNNYLIILVCLFVVIGAFYQRRLWSHEAYLRPHWTDRLMKQALSAKSSAAGPSTSGPARACAICGRKFTLDRIEFHEEICRRVSKKRKPYDSLQHRLAGTGAEHYINKLRKIKAQSKTILKPLNCTWEKKHEDFVNSVRAAKQVQSHLAAGGKLTDLPPPPRSENPDFIQCPHCQRRFNQEAAERHIPQCANYQFNKPKSSTQRKTLK